MKILALLHLLNRGKIVLFIGTLILCLGVISPWYRLPKDILETFSTSIPLTNIGIITAVLALIALLSIFNYIKHPPRLAFWSGLIATLLFPYFITTWFPTVDFIASAYYNQGKSVSQHVEQNFSQVQSQWKQNITLNQSLAPTIIEAIPDSNFFQMSSWERVIFDSFGYKNSILEFIGKGWSFSLIGLVISLIGLYLREKQILQTWVHDLSLLLPAICLCCALILIPFVGANIINTQINTDFAQGDYTKVVQQSQNLISWYPSFQGNVAFLERLAKAEFYTDRPDIALINFVKGLENYRLSNFQSAEEYWQKSLELQPNLFVVRGYLAAAILNQGVSYLDDPNNRQPAVAADIFEKALRIFPNHLEALYNLMLARVVNGEFSHSADVAQRIIASQEYFQNQRIGLMGQAYLHLTWAEYKNGDVNKAWERYRQSVDAKTWGKKIEEQK